MNIDLSFLQQPHLPWLESHTIFVSVHGSHAYGMSTPESDLDLRGVAVPPREMLLGYLQRFEQHQIKEPDVTIFSIQKFFKLCADGNPNALEILFTEPEDQVCLKHWGDVLVGEREMFLSQKIRSTFSGYARAQLHRIESHRKWLMSPPKKKPERVDFGLPEQAEVPKNQLDTAMSMVVKKMQDWDVDYTGLDPADTIALQGSIANMLAEMKVSTEEQFHTAGRAIGMNDNFLDLLARERSYKGALTNWNQYNQWKDNRNPVRAILEEKHGFDTKHASHLVRLFRSCIDVLETGKLKVRRPDAKELLSIKNGAWDYDRLMQESESLQARVDVALRNTKLPKEPKYHELDKLCVKITEAML